MGWGYIYMKESTDERETKTSKSGESSSDLAVEYDDERGVKNDGRLGRRHGSDDSIRRTGCGSTELQLKLWLKKEKKTLNLATPNFRNLAVPMHILNTSSSPPMSASPFPLSNDKKLHHRMGRLSSGAA